MRRALWTVMSILVTTSFAFAQQPSTGDSKTFRASAEVAQLIEAAKKEIEDKKLPNFSQPLLQTDAHRAMLERCLLPDFSNEALAELGRLQTPDQPIEKGVLETTTSIRRQ